MLPPVGKGAVSVGFVCPSIANNSRTQRPSVPKFGRRLMRPASALWCDLHTSFKVKGSKIKVTRPINADTHRAPDLPNGKLPAKFKLVRRRPASATGVMNSKVKGQCRNVTWSVWAVLAQCFTCVIRVRRGHTVLAKPDGNTSCYDYDCFMCIYLPCSGEYYHYCTH